jgi:hypothetical protein
LSCALVSALACQRAPQEDPLVERAAFGVFYGGQIQERSEIPLELDRTKQMQGLRIDFRSPLQKPVRVAWELDLPALRSAPKTSSEGRSGRRVKLDETTVPAGRDRFERTFDFAPTDPTGTWRIKVAVEDRVVLERAFAVVSTRAAAQPAASGAARGKPAPSAPASTDQR